MTGNELRRSPPQQARLSRVPVSQPQAPPPPLAGEGREGAEPHTPVWKVKPKMRLRARALRQEMTKAERIIWYGLRAHRLEGAGFRRQTPIGPYIVDFVSHAMKLIIEIDGGQHFDDAYEMRDKRRDAYLASKGFHVLRFSNLDVMTNRVGVLETIAAAVREARAPSLPSPASGGGGACGSARDDGSAAAGGSAEARGTDGAPQ